MRIFLLLLLAAAAPASAKSTRRAKAVDAQDKFRHFLAYDRKFSRRLDEIFQREAQMRAIANDPDLKDAVAQNPAVPAAKPMPAKIPSAAACPSLEECAAPEFATAVMGAHAVQAAVRQVMRPWLLLQQAKGQGIELRASESTNGLFTARLKGLDSAPLNVNVAPRIMGGFNVWLDEPERLAALYEKERAAALNR